MLDAIKRFFSSHIEADDGTAHGHEHRLQLATAALLLEIARADHHHDDDEFITIREAVRRTFELDAEETDELLALAAREADAATSDHAFTSLIHAHFTPEQKYDVVERMWQVAFADGRLDMYEEHLIRKLADLLYVPHQEFILARHRAEQRMRDAESSS